MDRKDKINEIENAAPTQDQIERKEQTISYCKKFNIPTINNLPCIESEQNVTIRNTEDIVNRALALSYLGLKSEGLEEKKLSEYEKNITYPNSLLMKKKLM